MAGVSGVRGIIGEGMTPEVAQLWATGFGSWLRGKKVVLSRDSRTSGKMLSYAVKAGLIAAGCDVDDIGVTTTPIGALSVPRRGAGGGIIITASHNPQQWNALKFVRPDGRMLTAEQFVEVEHIVVNGPLRAVSWDKIGTEIVWDGAEQMYLGTVLGLNLLDLDRIKRKAFRVAFDGVNGGGSFVYPKLLEALGCTVVSINADGSGNFTRPPEPLPANLSDLGNKVREEKCHIGFAVDPDGDRLAVVDERGNPVGEETTLALGIKAVLEQKTGPIVVNCLTSQVIDDIAAQYGVICYRTKVGEANVSDKITESKAIVGGEGNGGIILPQIHAVRDAGIGMSLILNLLSSSKKSVSEHVAQFPAYHMIKASYPVGEHNAVELVEAAAARYPNDSLTRIDGVRISSIDGWVQMRPSNTEPILRVYAEAHSKESAEKMVHDLITIIEQVAATV